MPSKPITVKGGATYAVSSAVGCTVSVYAPDGTEVQVCEVQANKQAHVTAHGVTMVVSDDKALVTEVFNGAPAANNGGGGGELTPAEQAAVTSLASGSINYDGALAVHAQQLWLYGASIDTMGGNVYHRTGSATFTGANTTAVMSGTGFIVYNGTASVTSPVIFRVSADASVDPYISLADAQGNEKIRIEADANDPYIKVNGSPVPTMTFQQARETLSHYTGSAVCNSIGSARLSTLLSACVVGGEAFVDFSGWGGLSITTASYPAASSPLVQIDSKSQMRFGGGVDGLKKMTLVLDGALRGAQSLYRLDNASVDFEIVARRAGVFALSYLGDTSGYVNRHAAKSLTYFHPDFAGSTSYPIGNITTAYMADLDESALSFPIRYVLPALTSGVDFKVGVWRSAAWAYDAQLTHLDITAELPSYVSSFSFYKANFNTVDNLVALMDNLGTPVPGAWPELSFGVDAGLVDDSGDEVVYLDPKLQSAAQRLIARGWSLAPNPLTD